MFTFLKKIFNFVYEATVVVVKKVKDFFKSVCRHIETITILVLATFGLSNLLGELPFYISLPVWVELPLVAPVVAVLLIKILLKINEERLQRLVEPVIAF